MTNITLDYYNKKAADYVENTRDVDFSYLQNEFAAHIKKGGRIIDLGCGSGRDSKAFIEMGFDVVPIDGSSELCKMASEFIGRPVICSTFQDYKPEGTFDGIWACASLLHLSLDDLISVMKKFDSCLSDDGIFYVSFKYGDFSGERHGRIFTDMNEQTFASLLKSIPSLEIYKQYITGDVRQDRESERWLNVFLKKNKLINNHL